MNSRFLSIFTAGLMLSGCSGWGEGTVLIPDGEELHVVKATVEELSGHWMVKKELKGARMFIIVNPGDLPTIVNKDGLTEKVGSWAWCLPPKRRVQLVIWKGEDLKAQVAKHCGK